VRIGFSVPKKKFKKAVQRNRMKRLLREAWRLNKTSLYEAIPEKDQLHIFLILTSNSEQNFETIRTSLLKAIEQIKKQITANE
jgi:ribonuclease P protein component